MIGIIRGFTAVVIVLAYTRHVAANAIFEVDLLRYEALPNKCCDGLKHVHFGPLKCNECDPYFKICLKQLPSGTSHCVKTTRENNVHTKDLTNGNIQPNHLSTSLQNWQGSMLVDVDIKDFDSFDQDDDIDHLYYNYTGKPDPTSKTVAINGTKVTLTLAIRIYCSASYFGDDCSRHCVNGTNSYCNSNGTLQCSPGYSGAPNCAPIKHSVTSESPVTTTISHKTSTARQTTGITRAASTKIHTSSTDVQPTTQNIRVDITTRQTTSSKANVRTTESLDITTRQQQFTEDNSLTSASTSMPMTDVPSIAMSVETIPTSQSATDIPAETTDDGTGIPNDVTTGATTLANSTREMVTTETTKVTNSPNISTTLAPNIDIPEPLELYSCNIRVLGHLTGVHTQVVHVLYIALSAHPTFVPSNLLGVSAIASTFEFTDNGNPVTDVSYVVHYDGQVLQTQSVTTILAQPPSSHVLHERLTAANLQRYTPTHGASSETSSSGAKAWTKSHLPFVIVMSCVVAILLIVATVLVVRRSRKRLCIVRSTGVNYDKFTNESKNYDMTFSSVDNPLYDYEKDNQPYNHSYT